MPRKERKETTEAEAKQASADKKSRKKRSAAAPAAGSPSKAAAVDSAASLSSTGEPIELPARRSKPERPKGPDPYTTAGYTPETSEEENASSEEDEVQTMKDPVKGVSSPDAQRHDMLQEIWTTEISALRPYEHADWLASKEFNTPWEKVAEDLKQPPAPSDPSQILRHWVSDNATRTTYYLMVVNNVVTIVYGFAMSTAGPSPLDRVYFLANDFTKRTTGAVKPPKLMVLKAVLKDQYKAALPATGYLCSASDVDAIMATTGPIQLAPQHVPGTETDDDEDDEGMYVRASLRSIFRIPAKLACMFLHVKDTRKVLEIITRMTNIESRFGVLAIWFQHAMTADKGDQSVNALINCTAKVVNVSDDDDLGDWYDGAVDRHAKRAGDQGEGTSAAAESRTHVPTQVTDATVDPTEKSVLLRVLETVEKSLGRSDSADDAKKAYKSFERAFIFKTQGLSGPDFSVYDEADMPPFFTEFLKHRGKARDARAFLETYLMESWPTDRPEQFFLFSTPLLNDFCGLLFNGRDPQCEWARRNDGVSIFGISAKATSEADARMQYEQFEDDTLTHSQKDKAANQALSAHTGLKKPPTDRLAFRLHLEYFTTFLEVFFTDKCPLIVPLTNIIVDLYTAASTNYWPANAWKSLLWNLHVGIRHFFKTGNPGRVINTMTQLQNHSDPNMANVPPELLKMGSAPPTPVPLVTPPGSAAGSAGGGAPPIKKIKVPAAREQREQRRPEDLPAEVQFAHHFADDISRVSGITEEPMTLTQLASTKAQKAALTGDLSQLGTNKKFPCLQHIIFGKCTRGNKCIFAHSFEKDPTTAQMNALKSRVKANCDTFLLNSGKG